MENLDPHERPPLSIRNVYKKYQKMKMKDLDQDVEIVDLSRHISTLLDSKVRVVKHLSMTDLMSAFQAFARQDLDIESVETSSDVPVYEHEDMPGLHIVPSLLPPEIQSILLSRLLHRDLSTPAHLTNIHTHYNIAYPPSHASFFSIPPNSPDSVANPIDPTIHKPISVSQLLKKKMRWTTLGGQYDWTNKQYPDVTPPAFPPDIKTLLESVFTDTKSEAAIVNLYSPGDTLSVHRDVAETSSTGLVSISLGCDAIFVIGTSSTSAEADNKAMALRLRSGSAVYMSGSSRFAWHGVPQIVPGTCPEYLQDWPGSSDSDEFEAWKGWMAGKRVNLNVRQMWE
ncbi:oxidoreductase [Dothidotthia symphoricarpi CBS 119687]|uniref:mRNA N(6)-methyladenine demethylase n=1 Tax=Dothidotthia symphoricarpi CBS 119687 TaxID=1392245 RepID=A0A6A5ZZ07_9PLEO|nr:oxidoreductase [Dothidotthia symphoricarpi CBS 119687]KAF2123551.1 oxidoreductase [Dothidotthia symphoricarpi CBS 119687]